MIWMRSFVHWMWQTVAAIRVNAISGVLAFLTLLILAVWISQRRTVRLLRRKEKVTDLLLQSQELGQTFDQTAATVLIACAHLAPGDTLALYTRVSAQADFQLRNARYRERNPGPIRPSYSGLAPYQSEGSVPVQTIRAKDITGELAVMAEGHTNWLTLLLPGQEMLIRVAPAEAIRKRERQALLQEAARVALLLAKAREQETQHAKADRVLTLGSALQAAYDISLRPDSVVSWAVQRTTRSLGARSGLVIEQTTQGLRATFSSDANEEWQKHFDQDPEGLRWLHHRAQESSWLLLSQSDELFYELPTYFSLYGIQIILAVSLDQTHTALYAFSPRSSEELQRLANQLQAHRERIQLVHKTIRGLLGVVTARELQNGALLQERMERMADLLDQLQPNFLGYSDLMARYAVVIARELGLPTAMIHDIALAAKFSQIGLVGLPWDLMEQEGRFSEQDYRLMKLHPEIGASLIHLATGSDEIAAYIKFHHERPDGFGYPEGLPLAEIPIGASILAVVQFYLAKINGRPLREPLPFAQAIQMMKAAAGTQLLLEPVQALTDWLENRRADPSVRGHTMAPCWSLCATPVEICSVCPAYTLTEVNCFEVPNTICHQHGRGCETCFVRTEYANRISNATK